MPDHVHVLVELPPDESLEAFAKHFKQLSGYRIRNETGASAWQVSYYDHILRREESIEDVARYVWSNPVKAGLVAAATEYRWSGPPELIGQA